MSFTDYLCPPDKFGLCGSVQLITRDNGDLSVLKQIYTLRISVRHGLLTVGLRTNLTFVEGTGGMDRAFTVKASVRSALGTHACSHVCLSVSLSVPSHAHFSTHFFDE